jgi:MOSC domain-containing protein YiiM
MKILGNILSLFIMQEEQQQKTSLILDSNGVHGDKHYNKKIERSILITSMESYTLVKEELNISMPYGYLGENLLISGNPYALQAGTQLYIGDTILEVTQHCTLCQHLSALDRRIPKLLRNDRGIFAKVIKGGEISINHSVYIKP